MADAIEAPQVQIPQSQSGSSAQSSGVPMIGQIDGNFATKMVPADQVDAATQNGWENAAKMTGPKGEKKWVPFSQVDDARKQQYAVSEDTPGAQKMVTPDGKMTYALSNEVDKFKASGHTLINKDNTFRVEPLPGEDNVDTMDRATKVAKALTPTERDQAMQSEIHPFDPRPVSHGGSGMKGVGRLAVHGIAAPIVATTATMGALAGGAELGGALTAPSIIPVAGGTGFGGAAAGEVAGPSIAAGILPKVGQVAVKYGLPYAAKAAGIGGAYYVLNKIFGGK